VIFVVDFVLNRLTDTAMCAETHTRGVIKTKLFKDGGITGVEKVNIFPLCASKCFMISYEFCAKVLAA
jgi:hypothetical protein